MNLSSTTIGLVLAILSGASFHPQLQLIWTKRDCTGISLVYILGNLIIATFHFALALHFVVTDPASALFSDVPPDTRDPLNLLQFLVVFLGYLGLFSLALTSLPSRKGSKTVAIIVYATFLIVTLGLVIDLTTEPKPAYDLGSAIVTGFLISVVAPLAQLAGPIALIAQARATTTHHERSHLSVRGLFIQAFVFLLVGTSFAFRMKLPAEQWKESHALLRWYGWVGWATVNNLGFAVAQGLLGWMAVIQEKKVIKELKEPLLG